VSSTLIRQDLVPIAVGYVLVMGALAVGLLLLRREGKAPAPGPGRASGPGPESGPGTEPSGRGWLLLRHVAATFVGGYLLLMAVVIGYYYGVARVSGNFIESAFTGCALLLGLSAPVFAAASWLDERFHRRRATRPPDALKTPQEPGRSE
jgi:hypothetical protein